MKKGWSCFLDMLNCFKVTTLSCTSFNRFNSYLSMEKHVKKELYSFHRQGFLLVKNAKGFFLLIYISSTTRSYARKTRPSATGKKTETDLQAFCDTVFSATPLGARITKLVCREIEVDTAAWQLLRMGKRCQKLKSKKLWISKASTANKLWISKG